METVFRPTRAIGIPLVGGLVGVARLLLAAVAGVPSFCCATSIIASLGVLFESEAWTTLPAMARS